MGPRWLHFEKELFIGECLADKYDLHLGRQDL
jgi:hypothetical protein